MRPATFRRSLPIMLGAIALAGLAGCKSSADQRAEKIRNNLTPELDTLHEREADINNAIAITFDENGRMINEDLGRVFLLNRPSWLTPEPVPRP